MSALNRGNDDMFEEAIAWHRALSREDADWDRYIAWLNEAPAHRTAFDEIALLDRMIDDHAQSLRSIEPPALSPPAAPLRRRMSWFGGLIATAAAVAAVAPTLLKTPDDIVYKANTRSRIVMLADNTHVILSPRSKLVVKAGDQTQLQLAAGEAYFSVPHIEGRTLSIRAADYDVRDIGTRFSVNLAPEFLTVAVAEGSVSVRPGTGGTAKLDAGEQLIVDRGRGHGRIVQVVSSDVASWRQGRLVYANAPLAVVAADLARYTGVAVTVDPLLRERRFSGVLVVANGAGMFSDLAELMSISDRRSDVGVRFMPPEKH
ncbi:hypothetical protein ABG067_007768 [Albugo candida]